MIRQELLESLQRYVRHGIEPGGFLRSVLENDLQGSFGRADIGNRVGLFEIVSYVYNEIPASCHGSREVVQEWIELGGQEGIRKASAEGDRG